MRDTGIEFVTEESEAREALQRKFADTEYRWRLAKQAGNEALTKELADELRPLWLQLREVMTRLLFSKTCPMVWTHDATEETIKARIVHPKLVQFASSEAPSERSALLMGPTGTGKSTAAAYALLLELRRRYRRGADVRPAWMYARALAQAAKYHPLGEGAPPEVMKASAGGLLILDDLGLERDPGEIIDVLHERYESGLPTWTTTGLNHEQLTERYGEALVRRLTEGRERPGVLVNAFPRSSMQ